MPIAPVPQFPQLLGAACASHLRGAHGGGQLYFQGHGVPRLWHVAPWLSLSGAQWGPEMPLSCRVECRNLRSLQQPGS